MIYIKETHIYKENIQINITVHLLNIYKREIQKKNIKKINLILNYIKNIKKINIFINHQNIITNQ